MVEIIASTLQDAIAIEKGGGDRIELVSALAEGGLTPSIGLIRQVLSGVSIPVFVMLRPISSSFVYAPHHLSVMREDALQMEKLGVKQVVMGILDKDGLPDIDAVEKVLCGTKLEVTFHRAFDESHHLEKALSRINSCRRITHLLTSGGPGKAWDNQENLKRTLLHAKPKIVVGSGVTLENAAQIKQALGIKDQADIHAGTALRHGNVHGDVDPQLVRSFVQVYNSV